MELTGPEQIEQVVLQVIAVIEAIGVRLLVLIVFIFGAIKIVKTLFRHDVKGEEQREDTNKHQELERKVDLLLEYISNIERAPQSSVPPVPPQPSNKKAIH
jgi:hypothetical protein